jgi:hypothetical protein
MAAEFCLSCLKGSLTCRNILLAADGFTSPLKEGVIRIFIVLKNPSLSTGFEPANLGSNGKHANHCTTEAAIRAPFLTCKTKLSCWYVKSEALCRTPWHDIVYFTAKACWLPPTLQTEAPLLIGVRDFLVGPLLSQSSMFGGLLHPQCEDARNCVVVAITQSFVNDELKNVERSGPDHF